MIVFPLVYGLPSILSAQIFVDKTTPLRHLRPSSMDRRTGEQFYMIELSKKYS